MKHSYLDDDGVITTPLRQLIRTMPGTYATDVCMRTMTWILEKVKKIV